MFQLTSNKTLIVESFETYEKARDFMNKLSESQHRQDNFYISQTTTIGVFKARVFQDGLTLTIKDTRVLA